MRAIRRHHAQRVMNNRRNYHTNKRELHRMVKTPCPCSCDFCANVREQEGPTIQERRFMS